MHIPILLISITLTTSLFSMESTIKNDQCFYKKLPLVSHDPKNYCYHSSNIALCKNSIDVANRSNDGLFFAVLIKMCLPPEIIQKHIAPLFVELIATKYKHKLIHFNYLKDHFKLEKIDHNNQWTHLSRHDGTYSIVPNKGQEYIMWQECNTKYRFSPTINDKKYTTLLKSVKTKSNLSINLASLDTDNSSERGEKIVIFYQGDTNNIAPSYLQTKYPISYPLLSSDNTLFAFGQSDDVNNSSVDVWNIKSYKSSGWSLNGSLSAICTAHHSPIFVAGSNKPFTPDLHNLLLFINDHAMSFRKHNAPITCVEFSPNDTRLVTCSYDQENVQSIICLWDTSNVNKIEDIMTHTMYIQDNQVHKAFFICNGEKIVVMQTNGCLYLLDGLTGDTIENNGKPDNRCIRTNHEDPLTIWSNKNKLIINVFDQRILFRSSETCKLLGFYDTSTPMTKIGLTADETTIAVADKDQNYYQLPFYDQQNSNDIDFIEKKANIIQLYEMFNICKQNKGTGKKQNKGTGKKTTFIETMKSYIQKQQINEIAKKNENPQSK